MVKEKIKEKISFRFKISGNIIQKLGGESIANKNIAVLELIKNAYDAGANKIDIQIKHEDQPENASIWICDDGEGMSHSDLDNKWMNIAAPYKSGSGYNKKINRPIIGEKGIGRLSAESLGEETLLTTLPKNEMEGYAIRFVWKKYQQKEILASEVVNEGFSFPKKRGEHGTTIEIFKLKHDWNDLEIQKNLLQDIYLMNPPNRTVKNFKVVPKFHIGIRDFKKIRPSFLQKASYCLKVRLTKGNILNWDFSSLDGDKKKGITHLDKRKLKCGDAVFELYFYYRRNKELEKNLKITLPNADLKEINKTLDEYKGIKLYRDNFRVKPYGDRGYDWVGVELAAQNNPSIFPRNNQIFGMVHITKNKNPKIKDTTTREGIIYSDEFLDLVSFIKTSLTEIFVDLRSQKEVDKKKARKSVSKEGERFKKKIPIIEAITKEVDEKIIDIKAKYPSDFYLKLEEEINGCYGAGFPNATFFLCRKFIENLVYDILWKKFRRKEDQWVWWDKSLNQPRGLSTLINNLEAKKNEFEPNVRRYVKKVLELSQKVRDKANPLVHNVFEYFDKKEELNEFKINYLIKLLIYIWDNAEK